ncbi:MAG: DUF1080 domain-containing protein [Pirellulales bacterium]
MRRFHDTSPKAWSLALLLTFCAAPVVAAEEKAKPATPAKATAAKPEVEQKSAEQKPPAKASGEKKPVAAKPAAGAAAKKPAAKKYEQPFTPGGKYRAHDMQRPRPPVVAPAVEAPAVKTSAPPSDAIVLFDGKSLDAWLTEGRDPKTKQPLTTPAAWPLRDGYMEVPPRSAGSRGSIVTRKEFGSCQLHIEWATPEKVSGNGQGRGNSGIMLHGVCEVQVLDSFENDTYPDGQAASIYSNYPPLVNASRKPGQWQTYDIILELARPIATPEPAVIKNLPAEAAKTIVPAKPKLRPARITVIHNGVVVQHAEDLTSTAKKFKLALQDHNNPVRFRNIWIRPLKERE